MRFILIFIALFGCSKPEQRNVNEYNKTSHSHESLNDEYKDISGSQRTSIDAFEQVYESLDRQNYTEARDKLLKEGWRAYAGNCSGGSVSPEICSAFPEIRNCSGTGLGYCDMSFSKKDKCLLIVTVGGTPQADSADKVVIDGTRIVSISCAEQELIEK